MNTTRCVVAFKTNSSNTKQKGSMPMGGHHSNQHQPIPVIKSEKMSYELLGCDNDNSNNNSMHFQTSLGGLPSVKSLPSFGTPSFTVVPPFPQQQLQPATTTTTTAFPSFNTPMSTDLSSSEFQPHVFFKPDPFPMTPGPLSPIPTSPNSTFTLLQPVPQSPQLFPPASPEPSSVQNEMPTLIQLPLNRSEVSPQKEHP